MERRDIIAGLCFISTVSSGCIRSNEQSEGVNNNQPEDGENTTTTSTARPRDPPGAREIINNHRENLRNKAFVAEEYLENNAGIFERTFYNTDAGTLVESDDKTRISQSDTRTFAESESKIWFTEKIMITNEEDPPKHTYYPNGNSPEYTDRDLVSDLFSAISLREDVNKREEGLTVFEATNIDGNIVGGNAQLINSQLVISEEQYIRLFELSFEIERPNSSQEEGTSTETLEFSYKYEVMEETEVTQSEPDFVDQAPQIKAHVLEDNSALVLEHTGGETVPADTQIRVIDDRGIGESNFPRDFQPEEEAYVYWVPDDDPGPSGEPAINIGNKPSGVARNFEFSSDPPGRLETWNSSISFTIDFSSDLSLPGMIN